jgi:hypothetical protein
MADLPRSKLDAHIGYLPSFGKYLSSYRDAVETLFSKIVSDRVSVDTLALPFLFMVRHSLEIGYKMNINYLAKYSKLDDKVNWDKHYLRELHQAFGKHYDAVSRRFGVDTETNAEFKEKYKHVEKLTIILDKIDRKSFAFRYPVDLDQNYVFSQDDKINLLDVKEAFDYAMTLLFHTADVLSVYTDYHDHMNDLLERELRSAHSPL